MAVVERGLARHGAVHRYLGELGQLSKLLRGLGEEHSHAGPDHRLVGVEQQFHGVFDVGGRGRLGQPLGWLIVKGCLRDLLTADVGRDFYDDRPGPPVAQVVESPPHHVGHFIRLNQHLTGFGHRLISARRGKVGPYGVLVERRSSGEVQDGHVVAEGLGQASHGVLRAGTALGNDYAELFTVVQAAVAVGRHDSAPFMPEHDGSYAFLGDCLDELVGGETRDPFDTFKFQDPGHGLNHVHLGLPPLGILESGIFGIRAKTCSGLQSRRHSER